MLNQVASLLSLFGFRNDDGTVPDVRIKSIMVPDAEAALEALTWLKDHGYRGSITMKGDGRETLKLLSATTPPSPRIADAAVLDGLWKAVKDVSCTFASVKWEWVPRERNGSADHLAVEAMEKVRSHSQGLATALQKHPERDSTGGLLVGLAVRTLPNRLDRRPVNIEHCPCRECSGKKPRQRQF